MESSKKEVRKLFIVEVDGQKVRAMKENIFITLHQLRIKLKSEITKTQKFLLEEAPISLIDEE